VNRGYSLLEMTFALGVMTTMAGIGVPQLLAGLDDQRAAAAARYVSTRIQWVRMQAVMRSAHVALQFIPAGSGFSYAVYADGNGDGVRSRDIRQGIDLLVAPSERLSDTFSGVDFGVAPGLPPIDSASAAPGTDPIKLGSSNLLSFSPLGSSSSGSLYIRGRGAAQYAVRVSGETGRVHLFRFLARSRRWEPV
jgi:type II secretory pathway pseudopilin PulG